MAAGTREATRSMIASTAMETGGVNRKSENKSCRGSSGADFLSPWQPPMPAFHQIRLIGS